jgi:hypothetical protein
MHFWKMHERGSRLTLETSECPIFLMDCHTHLAPINPTRNEIGNWDGKDTSQKNELKVADPTSLPFNSGDNISCYVPASALAFGCERCLRPAPKISVAFDLRAYNVAKTT